MEAIFAPISTFATAIASSAALTVSSAICAASPVVLTVSPAICVAMAEKLFRRWDIVISGFALIV